MFHELDQFSHLWVQFQFHQALTDGWRPTVRPPWLGGQKRVGLYASRSPHRPNFLGMSAVRYHGLRKEKNGLFLDISGMDLLQGTPVFDIKPYVPYSDRVEDASSGFVKFAEQPVKVIFTGEAEQECALYKQKTGRDLNTLVREILEQDPRPASQRKKEREYGMLLWDMNVRWRAEKDGFTVLSASTT
jgi:tRNA-Thr(GGU) m(6)t(6)A37 methyltransferase TsaA